MGAIKIGSTTVIDSGRKLTNIADGSGELSLSADTLTLSIGGTSQDTQSLQGLTVDQALKLTTARTITLNGDVSGSTTFDGSANKTITTTVAKLTTPSGTVGDCPVLDVYWNWNWSGSHYESDCPEGGNGNGGWWRRHWGAAAVNGAHTNLYMYQCVQKACHEGLASNPWGVVD